MATDVKEGDILVVDGVDYPIRSVGSWAWGRTRNGMRRLLTVVAATKRQPAMSGGKRGAPVTYLTGLRCMPLDPADPDVMQRMALNTPHELLQTVIDGGDTFYALIVEDLKR